MNDVLSFGDYLSIIRRRNRQTARGLSKAAGLTESMVSKIESNEIKNVSLQTFAKIVVQLDLNDKEIALLVRTEDARGRLLVSPAS